MWGKGFCTDLSVNDKAYNRVLFDILGKYLNVCYKILKANAVGLPLSNGNWTGAIGSLQKKVRYQHQLKGSPPNLTPCIAIDQPKSYNPYEQYPSLTVRIRSSISSLAAFLKLHMLNFTKINFAFFYSRANSKCLFKNYI